MKKSLITRKLIASSEKHAAKLFDVKLNKEDKLLTKEELIKESSGCDGILSAITDKFDNDVISKLPKSKMTVGMKIPPYQEILTNLEELNKTVLTNVTGVSDHATALKCITYDVNYVSIIPGRMEEVGIPALELLSYLFQAKHKKTKIISGSMRTIDQLKYTFQIGTIPTIGERVWPLVLDNNTLDQLLNLDYSSVKTTTEFSPEISKKSFDLSKDFFTQMNELGKFANDELLDL